MFPLGSLVHAYVLTYLTINVSPVFILLLLKLLHFQY